MSTFNRRADRFAVHGELTGRPLGPEGELGAHIEAASPETLTKRTPGTTGRRVDALTMAVTCRERTHVHRSARCLAELAILDCPEVAAATRLPMAKNYNLPERAVSMLVIAACILGPDPATGVALICAVGSEWPEDLGATPKRATLDALGRTIARAVRAATRKPPATARQHR